MNFIKNLNLSKKLVISSLAYLLLFFGTSSYSIYQIKQMSIQTSNLYNHPYTVSNAVRDINYYTVSMHMYMIDLILARNDTEIDLAISKVNSNEKKVYDFFKVLEERFLGSKEKVISAKDSFISWKPIRDEVILLVKSGKREQATKIIKGKGATYVEGMYEKMSYLTSFANKKGVLFFENTTKIESDVFKTTLIISVTSFIMIIIIGYSLISNVKNKFKEFESGLLDFFKYLNKENESIVFLNDKNDDEFGKMSKLINQNISHTTENIENEKKMAVIFQQQSKLAAMGEMVGAIAHQWRQPLNELSIRIQKLKRDFQKDKIDENYIESFIVNNTKTINFMSKTIDNFRNFFRVDKQKVNFNIKEAIEEVLSILEEQLKNHNINIIFELQHVYIYSYRSELQQAILNIVNNAKDALIEHNIKEPFIKIILNDSKIVIEDNAGGIPESIIDRIFEPYYTTKEQGKGTGMGLYMTKMIVEENMKCHIIAKNNSQGGVFEIIFNRETE